MSAEDDDELESLLNQLADGTLTDADDSALGGNSSPRCPSAAGIPRVHGVACRSAMGLRRRGGGRADFTHADESDCRCRTTAVVPPHAGVGRGNSRRRGSADSRCRRCPATRRASTVAPEVARLTDLADVQWPEGTPPLETGTPLMPGSLRLQSGTAQLAFGRGAVVTLTGPAELELITPQRAFLRDGAMVSYVPEQAQGFTVLSPHGQLVDLGTEFAVQVESSGQAEVHALTGKVQVAAMAAYGQRPAKSDGRLRREVGGVGKRGSFADHPTPLAA